MKKIIFIDHYFHLKTGSSQFFVDLLKKYFIVDHIYTRENFLIDNDILAGIKDYDLALVWQVDFIASSIISTGIPTVIIPMYDGSSHFTDNHWKLHSRALYINFSKRLHDKIQSLKCDSFLLRYFIKPEKVDFNKKFNGDLNLFFWERDSSSGINLHLIQKLFGNQLKKLHIHLASDQKLLSDARLAYQSYLKRNAWQTKVTFSNWFENKYQYLRKLDEYNIFLSPRPTEGIGISFLEAISKGMLVVANDAPTHDEYIDNWNTGILFDINNSSEANFGCASKIAIKSYLTAARGYETWQLNFPRLIDILHEFIDKYNYKSIYDPIELNIHSADSFSRGLSSYESFVIDAINKYPDLYSNKIEFNPARSCSQTDYINVNHNTEIIYYKNLELTAPYIIDISDKESHKYLSYGWSCPESTFCWMIGQSSEINFSLNKNLFNKSIINITLHSMPYFLRKTKTCIFLNDVLLSVIKVSKKTQTYSININKTQLKDQNSLKLITDQASPIHSDTRHLSIALKSISFK